MRKYEEIKFIGFTGLSVIPEHWNIGRIKDISTVKGRIGFRGYTKGDFVEKNQGGLVIGATEMTDRGNIEIKNPQFLSWQKYYESPEIILKLNDIVLVQRGSTVGKVSIIGLESVNATINPSLVILKKIKTNNQYLLYYLMSPFIQGYISAQTATTAIPMISQEQIGNYEVVLPPLTEQTQIATYLDAKTQAIDKKISLLTTKIEYYKELRKTIINNAVTKGLDKKVKLKESELGLVPCHWAIKRIKDVCNSIAGGTPQTNIQEYWVGNIPWIPSGKVQNNIVIAEIVEDYISKDALLKSSTKMAKRNSILIALTGATCSNIGYLTFDTAINQSIVALSKIGNNLSEKYIYYLLISQREKLRTLMTGGAQGGINQEDVKYFLIPFPPKQEQTEIATYIDAKTSTIDAIINNLQLTINNYYELRKTLINDVVTGKVKVTD